MKILAAQINPTIGDIVGNTAKVLEVMDFARKHGVDIVSCPEMTLCGYAPDDLVLHRTFVQEMADQLDVIVRNSKGISIIVGLVRKNPIHEEKDLLNSAAIISDGKLLGFHDKWLLPTYDVFEERRYFARGKQVQTWDIKGKRICVLICEDMWQNAGVELSGTTYPWDPVKELAIYKPDICFNLTASPFQSKKSDTRVLICKAAAKTLQCPVLYTCQVGANGVLIFDGYSLFVDKDSHLRGVAKGFEEDRMIIDLDHLPEVVDYKHDEMGDLYGALKLGVKDYFDKSKQEKAVIGLSGGIDSSLVACIATDALGKENVHGIFMPTRFSSRDSEEDAKRLAKNLGIAYSEIDIDPLYEHFLTTLKPFFGEEDGEGITEENLQARIRAVILMAFANKCSALLLSTGNKSEFALGFSTLYGDMAGALAVIGDLLKTKCYKLAKWINRQKKIIPPRVISKEPSAELRHHQKDTDTLPPYDLVDVVIKGYVEDYEALEEIARKYNIDLEIVKSVVRRIYKAEHKRRQAPPSLRVSKRSFAAGRRKPIHFSGSLEEKIY